jgi:signal transduction histidine kinase/DNA-binding response OmpR family regulator
VSESNIVVQQSEPRSATILIVEDDQDTLSRLSSYLTTQGFGLQVLRAGENVVEQAAQSEPVLILLDTGMPTGSGYAAFRALRADERTSSIPVIFLVDPGEPESDDELSAVEILTRPIRPRQVLLRLEQYLLLNELSEQLQSKDETLIKRATELEVASQIGQQITTILDPEKLTQAVVEVLQQRFDYYFVSIWQLNDRQDVLGLRAQLGRSAYQPFSPYFTLHKETIRSIVASVARSGISHTTADTEQDPVYMYREELPLTRSELALPLRIGPRMVGVLDIESDQLAAFTPELCSVFQALADQVAVAIRNAELYEIQRQRRAQAELLESIGRTLSSTLDIYDVQKRILGELVGVIPYELGVVYRRDGEDLHLVTRRAGGEGTTNGQKIIPLRPGSALAQIFETEEFLVVDDLTSAPGWNQVEIPSDDFSWLGVPLKASHNVIGILALTRADPLAFSPNDVFYLNTFAAQAAIALENAGLYAEIQRLNTNLEGLVEERTRQLDEAYRHLQKLDSNKSDFINVTAHELRTPITVIKGYLGMLQNDANIRGNDFLATILSSTINGVNRLHEIVNSMLDVARINSQVLTPVCEWVDLPVAVQSVQVEFDRDLKERNLSLTVKPLGGLPKLFVDPSLLYKVLYNIVVNAIKYTPDGGQIHISAQTQSDALGDLHMEILVRDTGIGIDPEHHKLIFDQFYQTGKLALHSSGRTKFKGGGPGLGLAIAKGIVDAHGGRIWVESERHDEEHCPGSCFHILLPVNGPPPKNENGVGE